MVAELTGGTGTAGSLTGRSLIWREQFPGSLEQPREARNRLAIVLASRADLGDILLVASELCSNAVVHTRSGTRGGTFTLEVTADAESLEIAVTDGGAPTGPRILQPGPTDTDCRGLLIVDALSSGHGVRGDSAGRTVWARFPSSGRAIAGPGKTG